MPKVSIVENKSDATWAVRFEYPDLDNRSFYFSSRVQAQSALNLARYVINNEVSLNDVKNES